MSPPPVVVAISMAMAASRAQRAACSSLLRIPISSAPASAKLLSNAASELSYQLPLDAASEFPALFELQPAKQPNHVKALPAALR